MMWCVLPNVLFRFLILSIIACGTLAVAQLPDVGEREIDGFRIPEFDLNGVLKSEIYGKKAKMLPDNKIRITELQIIMYKKKTVGSQTNEVDAVLTSEHCTVDQKTKNAFSNAEMKIVRENVVITGKGFRWSAEGQRIEILNNFHMVMVGRAKVWPLLKETK
ncbi:MAG: LPS export ABC transporter periplasmic protein LptC [bacterium]